MNYEDHTVIDSKMANEQIEREIIWDKFRQYLNTNNIDMSEFKLRIWFDGQLAVGMSCDGYIKDIIYWTNEGLYEVRQPKNKEVRYWETNNIGTAFDIMLERDTPENYKRLY